MHMVVMHGCFASWSARKMLLTTLGVVLTLSVMWICRPSARSMSVELQSTLTTKKLTAQKRRTIHMNINRQLLQNNYYSQMNITFDRILLSELDSSSDVYVSMRSTALFHKSRLFLLLHTWLQTIDPEQVYL